MHIFVSCAPGAVWAQTGLYIAGRFDVPVPPLQPPKQSAHVASMLYIADFLTQFTKVLAIKPISFQELSACLHPNTPSNDLLDPPAPTASRDPAAAPGRPTAAGSVATAPVANGVAGPMSNGTIAKGPARNGAGKGVDGMTPAGSEALFELYRGLLQFLLQVLLPINSHHTLSAVLASPSLLCSRPTELYNQIHKPCMHGLMSPVRAS